jgi:uncharacterized protein
MFSIQKFLGKDPVFFDLFERSADQAVMAAHALEGLLHESGNPNLSEQLRQARRASKEVTDQLHELVVNTFVTSLDREDIELLTHALYKIPKPIEKFVERYRIAGSLAKEMNFKGQASVVLEAAQKLKEMVPLIRTSGNLEHARRLHTALQRAEASADELEVELLKKLYSDQEVGAKELFITKDLYDLLEKSIDRCRDAGNVLMHIVLKNS